MRKLLGTIAIIISLSFCLGIPVAAVEARSPGSVMSTARFSFAVPANSCKQESTGFNLDAGEKVTVKGSVSPISANVKYGLVTPDGMFCGISAKDGILDYTFTIEKSGTYCFAVLNNSSVIVSVSGYINY